MLEVFRRHSRSTLIYVLFGMLIAVFVLTFNTTSKMTGADAVESEVMAEVAGVTIDGASLNLAMLLSSDPPPPSQNKFEALQAENMYERFRLRYAGGNPEAAALLPHVGKPSAIKAEKVMAELIEGVLVAQDAKQRGLSVADVELAKRVVALQRVFGQELTDENGNFDPKKYDQFVRYRLGTSKASLEEFLRREILRDKMAQIVTQGILIAPQEVDALFAADNQRTRLELLTLDAVTVAKAISVTTAEADAWSAGNADAIATEYAAQASKYKVPDKYNIRAILVAAPNADDETDEAKKKDAVDQRAAKRGAAEAIKADMDKAWSGEIKLDPVAPKSDDPDKPAVAVGEPKTATEVTGDERAQRLLQHFSKIAGDKTDDNMYKDSGGKYVDDYDAEKLDRQPFGPAVKTAVLGGKEMELIGPVQGKKGWWVLVIEKKLPGKETPLADARVEIAQGLLQKERGERELDNIVKAVQLAAQATPTTPLAEVVKSWCKKRGLPEDTLSVMETPPLGKSPMEALQDLSALFGMPPKSDDPDSIPMVGKHPEMAKAAAQLTVASPIAAQIFLSEDKKTRHLVRLANNKPTDEKADAKLKETLAKTLQGLRRQEAYRAYAIKLIEDATKASRVKKAEAFTLKVTEEKAKLADQAKRADLDKPKAEGGEPGMPMLQGGPPGGIKLNIGGKPVEVNMGQPQPAPAAAPAAPSEPAKQPAPEGGKATPEAAKPAPAGDAPAK